MPNDEAPSTVRVTIGGEPMGDGSSVVRVDQVEHRYPAPRVNGVSSADRETVAPARVDGDTRPVLRDAAVGNVGPSYSRFLLLAGEFYDSSPYDSELDLTRVVLSGSTWVSLLSAGSSHPPQVRVELWSRRPDVDDGWESTEQVTVAPERDQVEVTDFEAIERDAVVVPVDVGVRLAVRIQTRGGSGVAAAEAAFIRWLAAQDDATVDYANVPMPSGVEQWRIQLWPA